MDDEEKIENKKCFLISCLIEFLLVILGFILFYVGFTTYIALDDSMIISIGYNWEYRLFTDITINNNCPVGQKVIKNQWAGLVGGCKCFNKPLERDSCVISGDNKDKCYSTPSIKPKDLGYWDGQVLCMSGLTDSYLDLTTTKNICPSGFPNICGTLDEAGNILCMKSGTNCPINDIKIISKTESMSKYPGYKFIDLNTRRLIYTNTKKDGKILVEMAYGEDLPCFDPLKLSAKNYKLLPVDLTITCNKFNSNYQLLDSNPIKLIEIYNFHGVSNLNIQEYPSNDQIMVKLYYKGYVGLNTECSSYLKSTITNNKSIKSYSVFYNDLKKIRNSNIQFSPELQASNILNIITFVIIVFSLIFQLTLGWYCFGKCKIILDPKGMCIFIIFVMPLFSAFVLSCVMLGFSSALVDNYSSIYKNDFTFIDGCLDSFNQSLLSDWSSLNSSSNGLIITAALLYSLSSSAISIILIQWCKAFRNDFIEDNTDQDIQGNIPVQLNNLQVQTNTAVLPNPNVNVTNIQLPSAPQFGNFGSIQPNTQINLNIQVGGNNLDISSNKLKQEELEKVNSLTAKHYDEFSQVPPPIFNLDIRDAPGTYRPNENINDLKEKLEKNNLEPIEVGPIEHNTYNVNVQIVARSNGEGINANIEYQVPLFENNLPSERDLNN